MEGNSVDITRLIQGTDFLAQVSITNPYGVQIYKDMALSQIFPSGWEIHNTRMDGFTSVHAVDQPAYQDISDDRVYTYFDLKQQGTNTYVIQLNAPTLGSTIFLQCIVRPCMTKPSMPVPQGFGSMSSKVNDGMSQTKINKLYSMAYDELLADRMRLVLKEKNVVYEEKAMMGGLTFMVDGKMCVGIIRDNLMARIDPDIYDTALKRKGCREMDFTKRPMKGFVFVEPEGTDMDQDP